MTEATVEVLKNLNLWETYTLSEVRGKDRQSIRLGGKNILILKHGPQSDDKLIATCGGRKGLFAPDTNATFYIDDNWSLYVRHA